MGKRLSGAVLRERVGCCALFIILIAACFSCRPRKESLPSAPAAAPPPSKIAVFLPKSVPAPLLKHLLEKTADICLIEKQSDIFRCPFLSEEDEFVAKLLWKLQKNQEAPSDATETQPEKEPLDREKLASKAPASPPLATGERLCFCLNIAPPSAGPPPEGPLTGDERVAGSLTFLSVCPCDKGTCNYQAFSKIWRKMNNEFSAAAKAGDKESVRAVYKKARQNLKEFLEAPDRPEKVCIEPAKAPRRMSIPLDPEDEDACFCFTLDPPDLTDWRPCSCAGYWGTKNFKALRHIIKKMNDEYFAAADKQDDEGMKIAVQKARTELKKLLDREWADKREKTGGSDDLD